MNKLTLKSFLLLFYWFFLCKNDGGLNAQNRAVDSLKIALQKAKSDTDRCRILNDIVVSVYSFNPDTALLISQQCMDLAEADLRAHKEKDQTRQSFLKHLADALNNIAFLVEQKGDIPRALEYYEKSLKIREEIGNKQSIANSLNNLGILYDNQDNVAKALECHLKSLRISEDIGDKRGVAQSLHNLAYIYGKQGKQALALENYNKSLALREEIGDKHGVAQSLHNIAALYRDQDDPGKALTFYMRSLKMKEEIGDKRGITFTLNNLALIYLRQKNYPLALNYALRSLRSGRELGYPENIRNAAERLSQIYKAMGDHKNAFTNYELYVSMRDSIGNLETKKAAIKSQLKYEYEKRAAADSVKNAEEQKVKDAQLLVQHAQIKQEKFQRYVLLSGFVLLLVGLVFVINRFRITRRQKKIMEEQKLKVDAAFEQLAEKNREVLDSIYYARRIQRSLMPNENYIEKSLKKLRKT